MKVRDSYFDVLKCIAIFMVVFWHVMSYREGFNLAERPSFAANFIIAINMPLFFIISGYFSQNLHRSLEFRKLGKRLLSYFCPFAFFSIAFAVIESVVFGKYSCSAIPIWAIKKFLFSGWFFYALAGCDIITYVACRFGKTRVLKAVIALLSFIVCMVLNGRVWYVGSIVSMIPFYWFGFLLLPKILEHQKLLFAIGLMGGGVLAFVTFFSGNIATNGLAFYWDRFDIFNPQLVKMFNMFARYLISVMGSLFIFMCVRMVLNILPLLSKVSIFGMETLGIYLVQDVVIREGVNKLTNLDSNSAELFLAALITLLICYFLVKVSKVNSIMRRIVWQSTRGCKVVQVTYVKVNA